MEGLSRGRLFGLSLTVLLGATFTAAVVDARAGRTSADARLATSVQLVGTWRRTTTCGELLAALTKYDIPRAMVLEMVAGNSFLPGVSAANQIVDRARPCAGAVPRRHSHVFSTGGAFGSLDWRGRRVDDGRYEIVRPGTVVIFKEFPKVTFRYAVRGRTISFTPVIPKGCTSFRCAWAVSVAYPGKTWQRVR